MPAVMATGKPRFASACAARARCFSESFSRAASAVARSSAFVGSVGKDRPTHPTVITRPVRNCALERVTQNSRDFSANAKTPRRTRRRACAGYDEGEQCEAALAVDALDPGVPYESRWPPYVRIHGPGQGQFPKGSIRPRGYMAPDARHSFARANVATKLRQRQRRRAADRRDSPLCVEAIHDVKQPAALMVRDAAARLLTMRVWSAPLVFTSS